MSSPPRCHGQDHEGGVVHAQAAVPNFPDHLPRQRVSYRAGPTACAAATARRLSRLGEDITETLGVIPKSWKGIKHVREKFTAHANARCT